MRQGHWRGGGETNKHVRACHGPALVGKPITLSCDMLRPRPAHEIFNWWAAARPDPSNFNFMVRGPAQPISFSQDRPRPGPSGFEERRPGLARPMILAARPIRHGLYTSRSAIFVGQPVHLTGRTTGRPMCCPPLKSEGVVCADVFFLHFCPLFFLLGSLGQPTVNHPYQLPAHFFHTNGPLRRLPSRLADHHVFPMQEQHQQQQQQHSLTQHLQPTAHTPAASTPPTIDLSSERSKGRLIVSQGPLMLQKETSLQTRQRHTRK